MMIFDAILKLLNILMKNAIKRKVIKRFVILNKD